MSLRYAGQSNSLKASSRESSCFGRSSGGSGRSWATGRPWRSMVISSPPSASRIRFGKWSLA